MRWDQLTSYPTNVRKEDPRITVMLDTLEVLQPPMPVTEDYSRYSALSDFLEAGVASGLISMREKLDARAIIGPNM